MVTQPKQTLVLEIQLEHIKGESAKVTISVGNAQNQQKDPGFWEPPQKYRTLLVKIILQ